MNYITAWRDDLQMSGAEKESAEQFVSREKPDLQLVELILAGDEAAFENLFDRYKKLVASVAGRYFQRPEQIEDIIQISFAKIYFELKSFRGERDFSLAGWICKITTNSCLDALRVQNRKRENLLCEFSEAETEILFAGRTSTEKGAESFLLERDLAEKLLSHLKAEDRAVLQMLDAEEMTVDEVAQITGWSKSKIKIRAFRARGALRKILKRFL